MGGTYHHGKHGIRGLEAVGALFPQITVPLNRDDVATNTVSGLRQNDIGSNVGVLGGEGLSDAEAADSSADDHAVKRAGMSSARLPGGGGRRSRGLLLGDRAANAGAGAPARE